LNPDPNRTVAVDPNPAATAGRHAGPSQATASDAAASDTRGRPTRARHGVNLRDVAKAAEVSVATVSLVLNGSTRISPATRDHVKRVIDELGYQPNRLAQSLSGKYVKALAAILPDLRHAFADGYFGELLRGITDAASDRGFKVFLEQAKPEFTAAGKHVELFDRRFVDGVLLLGHTDNSDYAGDFARGGYPAVVVDNRLELPCGQKLGHVLSDYAGGAGQAMNYLIQLGHRKIALIEAAPEIATVRDIKSAWRKRLERDDLPAGDELVADGHFTEEGGAAAVRELLDRHDDLTAILASSDKMAIGAMHQLQRRGIRVPNDVSVVGLDDLPHAAFVNPGLTTIHLPLYEVGRRSCSKLIDVVEGKVKQVGETLGAHLVVRDSTALARGAYGVGT
jgi:DNA-binding LacI/PurR family transcriptional regulator